MHTVRNASNAAQSHIWRSNMAVFRSGMGNGFSRIAQRGRSREIQRWVGELLEVVGENIQSHVGDHFPHFVSGPSGLHHRILGGRSENPVVPNQLLDKCQNRMNLGRTGPGQARVSQVIRR